MEDPNRLALDLIDEAIDFAEEIRVGVRHLENDAAVLDFGVDHPGGVEAGLLLAEVATAGLATVQTRVETVAGAALTHVELATDHPVLSLLDCQAPAWEVDVDGATVRGGGPARLIGPGTPRADPPGGGGSPDFAVLVLESDRLPGERLVETVAHASGVPTSGVFVLTAPVASVAGCVAFAARAAGGAVARLEAAGADLDAVRSAVGSAPVAPIAGEEADARARAAAAVAEGGRAHLVVDGDVTDPERVVGSGGDRTNPPPAQVTLDVLGGPTRAIGEVDPERLADSLGL